MKALTLFIFLLLALSFHSNAQISVEECYEKAKSNYPLIKQYGLIGQVESLELSNANKGYLPQISLSAKASYQSDVTSIPESLGQILSQMTGRDISFPVLSKDQYQAVLEINQLIWDGGLIKARKSIIEAGSEVEKLKLETDLFSLNERINQLYFGALLIVEQLNQNELLKSELQANYEKIYSLHRNGVVGLADLDVIKVEQLNALQRETELKSSRNSFLIMLSAFTGMKIDESTVFIKPQVDPVTSTGYKILRPEMEMFNAQNKLFDMQKSILDAGNLPKLGLFVQGGYGKPGLNMFTDGFSPFYIGGIRFSWNIGGLYSYKNNLNKLDIDKKSIDIRKETFLFNTELKISQQNAEIEKLKAIITNDDEIITLRERIKKTASSKVDNGTLTTTDFVREINAENQARKLKALHEIQLLMSIYNLKFITNN